MVWDWIPEKERRMMTAVWAAEDSRKADVAAQGCHAPGKALEASEKPLESPKIPIFTSDEFRKHSLEELKLALRQPRGALVNVIGEHNWHRSTYSPKGQWVLKSEDQAINGHAELLRRDDEEGYDLRVNVSVIRQIAGNDRVSTHRMFYDPGYGFLVKGPICHLCLSRIILDHANGAKHGHSYTKCLFCVRYAKV